MMFYLEFLVDGLLKIHTAWPNTALEPTASAPLAQRRLRLAVFAAGFGLAGVIGGVAQLWIVRRLMRVLAIITAVFLLCGCSSQKRFNRDMQGRYEVQCDKYYAAYSSGSIEDAKKALHDIIDFSQAEKSKAKFYWRFDIMIAFAEARLAVIAEKQGHEDEASRLFAVASDDKVSGDEAFRVECRKEGDIDMKSLGSVERMTPEQWRKAIAALDKVNHVKWQSPNTALEPTATAPLVSTNK